MIPVACAVILSNNRILCAQRGESMKHPLKWEFPGGKVEDGEKIEACLAREIQEELNIIVQVGKALTPSKHNYNGSEIILFPFLCEIISGKIFPKEHKELQWLPVKGLSDLDWVAADWPVVEEVIKTLSNPEFEY
jgi:8-oxo-dGTP diphosphatase